MSVQLAGTSGRQVAQGPVAPRPRATSDPDPIPPVGAEAAVLGRLRAGDGAAGLAPLWQFASAQRYQAVIALQRTVGNAAVLRQGLPARPRPAALAPPRAGLAVRRDEESSPPEITPIFPGPTLHAQAEREIPLGEAVEVDGKVYVIHKTEVRSGGSSSWLANNVGNIDYDNNPKIVQYGAYPNKRLKWGVHRFAIFPDETTGFHATVSFLRDRQGQRDIRLMMHLFAPAGDSGNDPDAYAKKVAARMGVPITTLVRTMSDEQLGLFAEAIQEVEGWDHNAGTRQVFTHDSDQLPPKVRALLGRP